MTDTVTDVLFGASIGIGSTLFAAALALAICHRRNKRPTQPITLTQIVNVRPEPGENKQVQTWAVSRSYSHQCGWRYASSEKGTIKQLALKVKTKSSV